MKLKSLVQNQVAKRLFSIEKRDAKRAAAERERQAGNRPHTVEYFHDAADPYSHLMAQLLPAFVRRYEIELQVHLSPPPPDWAAPDRGRLDAYARVDAERLARQAGLSFTDPGSQPPAGALARAQADLLAAIGDGTFVETAASIGEQLWTSGDVAPPAQPRQDVLDALKASDARRDELGHYLGGTLYYAGEWYWGPDRLHYLEHRLQELGAASADAPTDPLYVPPIVPSGRAGHIPDPKPELHWYLSFRSPYTGIVADRVKDLANAYGAELKLRYVLPMVMRGMQVPRMKGFYIMTDTVREAERQGIPFGNSVDPVGEPVERGYAILHEAIERGQGYDFARSFLSGVWADGLDAGSDRGLKAITERAGLPWSEMKPLLKSDTWRETAEANQQEMFSYGLWGVPSFRVGDIAVWGQDRLWVIEDALKRITAS